ncbi:TPA: phage N-6-adenine-methyltransferase [Escherichia coli]|nr:phage N-6-adenine-methyltransferase [Escherichia coli]
MTIKSNTPAHDKDCWQTPLWLFDALDIEFGFWLDSAASDKNALCAHWLTEADDALNSEWISHGAIWNNPPYSNIRPWVEKAAEQCIQQRQTVVMLVPEDMSVGWFSKALESVDEVRIITDGRINFIEPSTGLEKKGNSKGSMLLIWRPFKRHDNVKRTIETLAKNGVIRLPQIEVSERINNLGFNVQYEHYVFKGEQGKRDSIVVVAQLSPEFTARLVDRWRELEEAAVNIPKTLPEALRLAADLAEQKMQLENQLAIAAPKVEFADRVGEASGILIGNFAKVVGIGPNKLFAWMRDHKILIASGSRRNVPMQEYMDRGYFTVKETAVIIGKQILNQGSENPSAMPMVTDSANSTADWIKEHWGFDPRSVGRTVRGWFGDDEPEQYAQATKRGERNNNPGNLNFAGQAGASLERPGGRFARFETAFDGLRALARQLMLYAGRGINSVEKIISTWAPASDNNNTTAYIRAVSQRLGVDPRAALNMSDPQTMSALMSSIIQHENGRNIYSRELINKAAVAGISGKMTEVNQQNTYHIYGGGDPHAVGNEVARRQQSANAQVMRSNQVRVG